MNIGQKTFQTEQELWHAFLSSDKNAFAYLFKKYADAMYAYGRKMTPDAELVKDAIQDVFVKLYNNRQNLRETVSRISFYRSKTDIIEFISGSFHSVFRRNG